MNICLFLQICLLFVNQFECIFGDFFFFFATDRAKSDRRLTRGQYNIGRQTYRVTSRKLLGTRGVQLIVPKVNF